MTAEPETILIVDDTPENLDILVGILKEDYRLKVATDGQSALELAAETPPDLILLDIMMPEMDGFEVCRRLKAEPRLGDVPVIFVSALGDLGSKVRAFTGGGVDYVTKPFQPDEVKARVVTHLELQRQRRELAESYERLRGLEKLRDNLVHMIVHDMRSPLMGITGMLEILKMELAGTLHEQHAADFEDALTSGNTLKEMISSLLDVSRMEAGEMPLDRSAVDLREVVTEAIKSLAALVKQCRVIFAPPEQPVTIDCDPEVTRRIVANLVANAIKFTPRKGEVRIGLEHANEAVTITVTDTGPGIPPEYRTRIFEKFGQVEGRQGGKKYSTGLGLTFFKLAVEAHGGEIGVDSEVGKGSTFWFVVPRGGRGKGVEG